MYKRQSRDRSCRRFKFPGLQRVQRSLEDHAGCPLDLSGRGTRCLVAASTRTACRHSKRAQIWRSMAARKAEMCLLEQPLQQTHDEMLFVKLQVEARSMPRTIRMYIPWVQSNIASTLRRMSVVAYSSPYLTSENRAGAEAHLALDGLRHQCCTARYPQMEDFKSCSDYFSNIR